MTDEHPERAIGRIEGKLDLIIDEQKQAAVARKAQYEKLEAVDKKVDLADNKVDAIDKRLKSVEAPVAEFSRWRERAIGAIMLISFVSAVSGGLIVAFWRKLSSVLWGN